MLTLKTYQQETLRVLREYLETARYGDPAAAFEVGRTQAARNASVAPYRPIPELEDAPYICLRLPTGGGKTLLAAYTVNVAAAAFMEQDHPLVLWLVPTNTIRKQTLETLANPHHPNREALESVFGSRLLVLDIADFTQIRPQDLRDKTVIVIGTVQTLRVDKTEGRKVYAHHEALEPHFTGYTGSADGLERIDEGSDQGKIRFSFRNLLAIHRPLVLTDEAHNSTSPLSFEVLQRIRARCIIEFTATPAENSNILHSVSAAELKAEEMIKLPVVLTEHQTWQEAISAAVQTREKLFELARHDRDYIRPIVLFQAQEHGHAVTYDVLLNYLVEQEHIDRERIAVATGDQRELDKINLLDPKEKIDFVITVEALKEGWDCPFAYVFCSVANIHSKKDVEQILGRVLRMPYARKRVQEELNRAYANVSSDTWQNAVFQLQDHLVSMGFEEQEAALYILPQPQLLPTDNLPLFQQPAPLTLVLSAAPDTSIFSPAELEHISTHQVSEGKVEYRVTGMISPELAEKLVKSAPKSDRDIVQRTLAVLRAHQQLSPAEKRELFRVPQLCLFVDGELEVARKEWFLDGKGWKLLDFPSNLTSGDFSIDREADTYLIDLQGKRLVSQHIGTEDELDLGDATGEWTELSLSRDLDRKLRQPDIAQPVLLEFLRRTIQHLIEQRGIPLVDLVRTRFVLEKALRLKIASYRQQAYDKGYNYTLFENPQNVETSFDYAFSFDPDNYPARWHYQGRYKFNRHYYPLIGELKSEGEEFECARAIDRNPLIRCWVRNLAQQPHFSFKLPTSSDYFYPDFVALLKDNRILVIEYKGEVYKTNDDSKEKRNLGELWAEKSNSNALFLMAVECDEQGRDVYKQIEDEISGS
jgi:type III restriction enzyme